MVAAGEKLKADNADTPNFSGIYLPGRNWYTTSMMVLLPWLDFDYVLLGGVRPPLAWRASFDPSVLASLERVHQPASVRAAFAAARAAGYVNLSLDLIYGTEGETLASWERTLREAIMLAPEHVSAYALTIEPATALGRQVAAGARPAPDPDLQADMFQMACELLCDAGYRHYEVSNWARPGYECEHNLGYWERRPYVGLGAGAHSYRDDVRWWNVRPPEMYLERVEAGELPIGGSESLDPSDAYLEEVFLRLADPRGRARELVRARTATGRSWRAACLVDDLGQLGPDRARDAAAERARARV